MNKTVVIPEYLDKIDKLALEAGYQLKYYLADMQQFEKDIQTNYINMLKELEVEKKLHKELVKLKAEHPELWL